MDNLKRKANNVISKYINTGSGQRNAIAIQDLVRRMNGSGLKVVSRFAESEKIKSIIKNGHFKF